MSSQPVDRVHPVRDFASRVTSRLEFLATVPVWSMSPQEQRETLAELAIVENQLAALRLRVLVEADRSGATDQAGAQDAAAWVAGQTRQVRREAKADLRLAKQLDQHPALETAMAAGRVNVAQARVILTALDRLPATGEFAVDSEQRTAAEEHLIDLAPHHDARELAVLGRRVFEVIAPEVAERLDGKILEAQEAQALRRTTFSMWEDDQGTCHGRFRIPALHGQMLHKMLLALDHDTDPDLPAPARRGVGFTRLLEAIPATSLPKTGGCGATIVVTMTLAQLLGDLEAAGVCALEIGGAISAAEARRLACSAGIIPVVLGGKSQVLDVGRRRRFHTEAMRIAMSVRDRGCTAQGCDTPPGLCPRPPRPTLVQRRAHQHPNRETPLRPPPPPPPQPQLPNHPTPQRHHQLPPENVRARPRR
jgi:hypothetical protein